MENNNDNLIIGKLRIDLEMSEIRRTALLNAVQGLIKNLQTLGIEINDDFEIILKQEFFNQRTFGELAAVEHFSDGAKR